MEWMIPAPVLNTGGLPFNMWYRGFSVSLVGYPANSCLLLWCVQGIDRPLTEDEFERIEYYAPRVKRIQELCPLFPGRLQGYVTYESSVLAAFAPRWTPEKPLFPNLRIFRSPAAEGFQRLRKFL